MGINMKPVAALIVPTLVVFAKLAAAQEPASAPATTTVAPQASIAAPAPAPAPVVASHVDRYQGGEGDAVQSGDVRCVLRRAEGIKPSDARTALALACLSIKQAGAPAGDVTIDFGTLGTRVAVSATREGVATKTVLLQGIEEMPEGSHRLADAFVGGRSVEGAVTPDTVLATETRQTKTKGGQPEAEMGVFGQSGVGAVTDASAGVEIGLSFRFGHFAPVSHLRAGGISSGEHRISGALIDVGGRYYLGDGDFAPYAGAGMAASHTSVRNGYSGPSGAGIGVFGEVGIAANRSGKVGYYASFRADVPFYALDGSVKGASDPYVLPLALNMGLAFR